MLSRLKPPALIAEHAEPTAASRPYEQVFVAVAVSVEPADAGSEL